MLSIVNIQIHTLIHIKLRLVGQLLITGTRLASA